MTERTTPVAAFVVDDSAVSRAAIRRLLASDPRIVLVGEASSGEEALARIPASAADVVLMDIVMQGLDGLATTRELMRRSPRPVLIISDQVGGDADLSFEALRAGALDVIGKPASAQLADPEFRAALCRKVRVLAGVPVVTRFRSLAEAAAAAPGRPRVQRPIPEQVSLVAIGASTGGPPALGQLLSALPPRPRWPVLVVQHMAPGFIRGLASWLETTTSRPVRIAEHGALAEPGVVHLAPDGRHLELVGRRLRVSDAPPVEGHRPSVDALMASIASTGPAGETVGLLLTGMGRDGAFGLGLLREAGAWTIAQDEATSVVWGMPKAAVESGAAHEVLPLPEIAATLRALS